MDRIGSIINEALWREHLPNLPRSCHMAHRVIAVAFHVQGFLFVFWTALFVMAIWNHNLIQAGCDVAVILISGNAVRTIWKRSGGTAPTWKIQSAVSRHK